MRDVVAVGLDLKPETLLSAYSQGAFPWPCENMPLLWHCPARRAVFFFKDFHYPRRLKQYLRKAPWHYTVNRAFDAVISASQDRGLEGTWITPEMKDAYREFHHLGHAHSVEVWHGKKLVGGLYGVDVAGYFAGESMFHREDNASKAAVLFVIALLKQAGRKWMDIQVLTPHMMQLGAKEIPRRKFLSMIGVNDAKPFTNEAILKRKSFVYQNFSRLIEKESSSAMRKTPL